MKNLARILCVSLLTFAASAAVSTHAKAAQLIFVDSKSCAYCAKFKREIVSEYNTKGPAAIAPIRRVSALQKWPSDLAGIKQSPFTPAFIVVSKGREIGRFYGYENRAAFYSKLNSLVGG
jgi:hypothetical protein